MNQKKRKSQYKHVISKWPREAQEPESSGTSDLWAAPAPGELSGRLQLEPREKSESHVSSA